MPNAPETRRDNAGTSRNENARQVLNLFRFPALYDLGAYLDEVMPQNTGPGRRSAFRPACLLAVVAATRIYRSQSEALRSLRDPALWSRCQAAYLQRASQPLPPMPPNRDHMREFRQRASEPTVLDGLQQVFRRAGVGQARALGNLTRGKEPDWARPDERHTIYGDGVALSPYSRVTVRAHPITGEEVAIGSRARSAKAARRQTVFTDFREDGKDAVGVNFVAVHTWTSLGRVVLGTGMALGAEQWAALELADSLAELAGDGIHNLLWDGALTGWCVDYLMGAHRIQMIGKNVGRPASELKTSKPAQEDRVAADALPAEESDPLGVGQRHLDARAARLAAEHKVALDKATKRILRHDLLTELFYSGRPQPVGTCLYPYRGSFDVVFSRAHLIDAAEHPTAEGTCRHDLVVDDGALYQVEVDPEEGHLVKTARLRCLSSRPIEHSAGRWGSVSRYGIPCAKGSFTYNRTWTPTGTRYTPQSTRSGREPVDQVGIELRPITRHDEQFHQAFSRRNDAESYNNWVQNSLPRFGRAASEKVERQALDFLAAAILNNSETWSRR